MGFIKQLITFGGHHLVGREGVGGVGRGFGYHG